MELLVKIPANEKKGFNFCNLATSTFPRVNTSIAASDEYYLIWVIRLANPDISKISGNHILQYCIS